MANFNPNYGTYNPNPYNPNLSTSIPTPVVTPQPRYISPYEPVYVTGIEGANAYQMPAGVTQMFLWDTDKDSFYVKKIDEMGRPRVVAWKDFVDHVEPEKPVQAVSADTTNYLTKGEFEEMFNKALSELAVGERGRIVRINELNS